MIIISCPGGYVTGGTELLHQLGYKLNLFGFETYIRYYGTADGKPSTHPYFLKYNVPVIEDVEDDPDTILVYPEMMALSITKIKKDFPLSKHVLWWLSVDNAQMTPEAEKALSGDDEVIHMAQSYYAMDYVRDKLSVPEDRLFYLSDYINYNFLNMDNDTQRDNTVLFNPRKGFERTAGLIGSSDLLRIKWRELAGIAPEKIPDVLRSAKVYIDFGNHPGKDRFPREAVACGCRIVTGKRGAAANDRDVPIPERFKIDDSADDSIILEQIYYLMDNYDATEESFSDYKRMIDEEFHSFETDALNVFSNIMNLNIEELDLEEEQLRQAIIKAVTEEEYKRAVYLITVYRLKGLAFDEDMLILEGYTRLGLGEEQVTLYLMNSVIANNDSNYEAHLIKARAMKSLGDNGAARELNLALDLSMGTEDEEYIRQAVSMLQ